MTLFDVTDGSSSGGLSDTVLAEMRQWRLVRIEVVNWGTFHGLHTVDVARKGHLFTGASGSGKSSLLDAIAAVLTQKQHITFNAAAQETVGRKSDRTWITYVRGAWSKEADEFEDRTVATFLRPGATWSGILLRFEGGGNTPVTLVRLFHLRGSSTDPSELKEMNVITRRADNLMTFAQYANVGIDMRRLVADLSPVVATTTGKHGAYFQRLRRELGIRNETALQLLHRTQAAKNLGTLDTLFRRFMLDEPPTFKRADSAVEQFAELRDAYRHVVDLRRQRDALMRVTAAADSYDAAQVDVGRLVDLADAVPTFAARLTLDLSREALIEAQTALATAASAVERVQARLTAAGERQEAARARVHELGGGDLAAHRARIHDAEEARKAVAQRAVRLAQRLGAVGLPAAGTEAEYTDLLTLAREELHVVAPPPLPHELHDRLSRARARVERLASELEALERHRSKIDARLLRVRAEICRALGLAEQLLPFAGELISVKPEHQAWTGAIERVLAPLATALLVRDDELAVVRTYIAEHHLGVNLAIDAVPSVSQRPLPARDSRSLVYRMDVAAGLFAEYLNRRLGDDFDVACVDTPADLDEVSRGVTIGGLVKRAGRRYLKADRYRVDDRSKWVLGGDIGPKRDELETLLAAARTEYEELEAHVDRAVQDRDAKVRRRELLHELVDLPFAEIDVVSAGARIAELRTAYELLAMPDSDLGRASAVLDEATDEVDRLREEGDAARERQVLARDRCEKIQHVVDSLVVDKRPDLAEDVTAQLAARFNAARRVITFDQVDAVSVKVQAGLHAEVDRARKASSDAAEEFVTHATTFSMTWKAVVANANLTVGIEDRGGYRAVLKAIVARGLPEHEANFRKLLDTRSRESITFLRDDLRGALRQVQSRIGPVNDSLLRSPFDRGRWLHIRVKLRQTQEVKDFLDKLGSIVDGNWADEDLATAERRFAVLEAVMQQLGSSERPDREWRTRVLDTREHITFIAEEADERGEVHNVHDSSAGLSGGQRQKLVVFCLAAALRYQLADVDAAYSNYAVVVLDEAFDKADADYTRMAMDVFVRFGFQMILATPGKLLQTLEPYIGAVTVVTNPDRKASQLANVAY